MIRNPEQGGGNLEQVIRDILRVYPGAVVDVQANSVSDSVKENLGRAGLGVFLFSVTESDELKCYSATFRARDTLITAALERILYFAKIGAFPEGSYSAAIAAIEAGQNFWDACVHQIVCDN